MGGGSSESGGEAKSPESKTAGAAAGGSEWGGNNENTMCVVCLSDPRDTSLMPCRHMCVCYECATDLVGRNMDCPMCRQPVKSLLKLNVAASSPS